MSARGISNTSSSIANVPVKLTDISDTGAGNSVSNMDMLEMAFTPRSASSDVTSGTVTDNTHDRAAGAMKGFAATPSFSSRPVATSVSIASEKSSPLTSSPADAAVRLDNSL